MYSTVRNSRSSQGRLLVCLVAVLAVLLSFSTAAAFAEETLEFTYVDYSITMAVGDTITLNGMKFRAQNTGHYGEDDGYPSCHVSGDGYNAVSLAYEFDDVLTSGETWSALNNYYCDVSLTVTAIAPGTATACFEYGTYYLYAGLVGGTLHTMYVPRITITVVEEDPCSIAAYPPCTENTSNNPYPTLPVPERPEWEFLGWYTQPRGGTQVTDALYAEKNYYQYENVDRLYAHWAPDYTIAFNNPGADVIHISDGAQVTVDQAIIPYETNVKGLHHDGFTFGFWIDGYERYTQGVWEEPVWTMEELTNPGAQFVMSQQGNNSYIVRTDGQRPQAACEAKLRLSCSWGGVTRSFDVTVRYQKVALPTGTDIPDIIDLQLGQATPLRYHFSGGYTYEGRDWYTGMVERSWEHFIRLLDCYTENGEYYLRPSAGVAGYFYGTLTLIDANVAIDKEVIFRIADENGVVPAPRQLEDEYSLRYLLVPEDTKGFDVSIPEWGDIWLNHPLLLDSAICDSYSISASYVEGVPVEPRAVFFDQENLANLSIAVTFANLSELRDGEYSCVDLTLNWGEWSETARVYFHFVEPTLPDIGFDTGFTLKAGETYEAKVQLSDPNWNDQYILFYDFYDGSNFDTWFDYSDRQSTSFCIRPHAPGYYMAAPHIHAGNLRIQGDWFLLAVTDEEGNLPEIQPFSSLPEGYVEAADYLMCPIAETTDSTEGWFSDAYLFGWGLDELDALRLAYGEDPSVDWSIEYVDGVRAGLTPEPYQVDGFAAGGCYIRVSELPKEAGTMRARLVCNWAGHTGYLPIEIHFTARPDHLPENTMVPSRLTLPLGGSLTITSRFPDAEDELYNGYAYLYLGNKTTVSVERVDAFSFRLTGLAPGTVSGMTGTGAYQNAFYHRGLTVTVDDTPIALPGNLKTIETEAFAGIDDEVFFVDDTVSEIQAGAFEPHVTIVCPEDSYAFRRCEELGLCVIGTSVE